MQMDTGNRVLEIPWRQWSKDAFDEARNTRRPILLSISAVWCHWCHVMDRTSFSDENVIATIRDKFIPIRVNTDIRPDINAQYNMGGWPTVAVLDHEAHAIAGTTYLPPDAMLSWLNQVLAEHDQLAKRARDIQPSQGLRWAQKQLAFDPSWDTYSSILKKAVASYDRQYGGFGGAPKFPMFDTLDLLLHSYTASANQVHMEIVRNTLVAMTTLGTFDHVEGGLFRYSTTRDWSIPHYEKMLLDNASLLLVLAKAYRSTGDSSLIAPANGTAEYMNSILFIPEFVAWAGSQDADEDYYALTTREERKERVSPRIDRVLYVDWNARASAAMIYAGRAFEKPQWVSMGINTLVEVFNKCFHVSGGLAHSYDGTPHLWGLAHDTISYGAACLHAFDATGDMMWLERSQKLAHRLIATHNTAFRNSEQTGRVGEGLLTRLPTPDDPPGFARVEPDFHENAYAALWFTRLAQAIPNMDSRGRLRLAAHSSLAFCHSSYELFGILASPYALALAEYLESSSKAQRRRPDIECEKGVCRPSQHIEASRDHPFKTRS
ncbi:MAG: DUF255 domain-containing protein [Firmicutes bacterium]|nr:DUF255 domain-containing protein [Bacillota bacterium]MDD4791704.1 DUF255 domain-containing protein [Bacillota bacterium]